MVEIKDQPLFQIQKGQLNNIKKNYKLETNLENYNDVNSLFSNLSSLRYILN